jgi:hypothetical protein
MAKPKIAPTCNTTNLIRRFLFIDATIPAPLPLRIVWSPLLGSSDVGRCSGEMHKLMNTKREKIKNRPNLQKKKCAEHKLI